MIIDLILDRKDGVPYDAEKFYSDIMGYESEGMSPDRSISAALDGGTNEDVQKALCNYVLWSANGDRQVAGYEPLTLEEILKTPVCQYINSVNWLEDDEEEITECSNKKINEGYLNMTTIPTINTVEDDWYLPEIADDEFNCGIDTNVAPMVGAQDGMALSTMEGGEEDTGLDYLLQMAGVDGTEATPEEVVATEVPEEEYKYQPVDDIFSIGFENDFDNSLATPSFDMTDDDYDSITTIEEPEVPEVAPTTFDTYDNEIDAFDGIMDTPTEEPIEEPVETTEEVPVEEVSTETVEANPEDMVLEKQPETDDTEAQQIKDYLVHNKEVLYGPASAKIEQYRKSLDGKSVEELRVEAEEVSPNWKKYIGKYKITESVKVNESENLFKGIRLPEDKEEIIVMGKALKQDLLSEDNADFVRLHKGKPTEYEDWYQLWLQSDGNLPKFFSVYKDSINRERLFSMLVELGAEWFDKMDKLEEFVRSTKKLTESTMLEIEGNELFTIYKDPETKIFRLYDKRDNDWVDESEDIAVLEKIMEDKSEHLEVSSDTEAEELNDKISELSEYGVIYTGDLKELAEKLGKDPQELEDIAIELGYKVEGLLQESEFDSDFDKLAGIETKVVKDTSLLTPEEEQKYPNLAKAVASKDIMDLVDYIRTCLEDNPDYEETFVNDVLIEPELIDDFYSWGHNSRWSNVIANVDKKILVNEILDWLNKGEVSDGEILTEEPTEERLQGTKVEPTELDLENDGVATVHVYNIEWDCDGANPKDLALPTEVDLTVAHDGSLDIADEIADQLSDDFGFCHYGFDFDVKSLQPDWDESTEDDIEDDVKEEVPAGQQILTEEGEELSDEDIAEIEDNETLDEKIGLSGQTKLKESEEQGNVWLVSGDGKIEISAPKDLVNSVAQSGDNSLAVKELKNSVKDQLAKYSDELLREFVKSYGNEETETMNREALEDYVLWNLAWDSVDSNHINESAEKIEALNVDIEPEEVKVEETKESDLKHEIPENDMIKDNIDTGEEIKVDTPVEAENGEIETKEFEVKETTEADLKHEIKDNEPIKDNIDTGSEVKVDEIKESEKLIESLYQVYNPEEDEEELKTSGKRVSRSLFDSNELRNMFIGTILTDKPENFSKSLRKAIDKMPDEWIADFLRVNNGDVVEKIDELKPEEKADKYVESVIYSVKMKDDKIVECKTEEEFNKLLSESVKDIKSVVII